MNILYLAHRVPFPPNKGDKIRSFHEIRFLARNHAIHLLAFCDDPADAEYAGDLEQFCRSVTLIALDRRRQTRKALVSMLRGKPWTLGFYESHEMRSAVWRKFREASVDVALAYSSSVAPYLASLPCRRVLDFVDSDAAKWQQYSRMKPFPKSLLYRFESRRLSAFELQMIRLCEASVFVSSREVGWIGRDDPFGREFRTRVHFIPNGIDLDYFQPRTAGPRGPVIIFTGAMDYFPNVDAVQFFVRSVFPMIRSQIPSSRFLIVGRNPARSVRKLAEVEGVTVAGTVLDVRPFLAQARVAVVPLRISQGMQNKVLEALATGLPVVASPQVTEGLHAVEQLPVAVASDPRRMADSVVRYLTGADRSDSEVAATRSVLEEHYGWERNLSRFAGLLLPPALASAATQSTSRPTTPIVPQ